MSQRFRIVASGTLFVTHTLSVGILPDHGQKNNSATRASSVRRERGGASATVLTVLAQFSHVAAYLVAPVGSGPEGEAMLKELETAIPSPKADRRDVTCLCLDDGTKSVVNHNPIPDILHDEFVRLVAPLLSPPTPSSGVEPDLSQAPFECYHQGRTVQTTLSNLTGLDGLAQERGWRNKVVFSVEISRPGRQGQEALIKHADVVFFSHAYASAQEYTAPRPFLLAMARISAPHALLCVEWGQSGCAMLSIPTKEYFQSSPFVPDPRGTHRTAESLSASLWESVRSGTPFYSEFGDRPDVPVAPSASGSGSLGQSTKSKHGHSRSRGTTGEGDDWGKMYPESVRRSSPAPSSSSSDDERRTITGASWHPSMAGTTSTMGTRQDVIEEAGAGDAFAAGMIFALSRRLLPGAPYSPGLHHLPGPDAEKGRWRLEECLRFGTEMVGRKIRRRGFEGLARAMEEVGWFED
ncbi:ketohexokinase [Rhizoctonia solani]|uniref:Ketohexokinase n=1 Tax=Rhizoctonia solani TaxID=456999 RepID=A0A8H7M3F0_9AGAM|nr:ketohexokinase [Rhizoctonia solani]